MLEGIADVWTGEEGTWKSTSQCACYREARTGDDLSEVLISRC